MKHFLFLLMLTLSSIPAFAQVPMQTTQDKAEGNRLIINGQSIFVSGMNIAWHQFGSDLHDNNVVDESAFRNYIKGVKDAGGNAVRWWLHNDASFCPKIDADGKVTGLAAKSIESMRRVLDIAYEQGVVVSMCLFSHNLMKADQKSNWSNFNIDRNHKLFTSATNMDTYIDNALKPILAAVGNHPAVMAWEVFNEPEGMSSEFGTGWNMDKLIPHDDIITFTAKVAVAVHEKSKKMVSTGIHEFNKSSYFSRYTEAKLKAAAGNNEKAYLDFYMAHWYPEHQSWCGTSCSPFHNQASFWGLSRPIVIGEFPGKSWTSPSNTAMTITAAYEYAYNNGYAGALGWSLTDASYGSIEEVAPALKNLSDKYKSDIEICTANDASCSSTPIMPQNYQQGETVLKYYNMQGKPLGYIKPKEPGIYIAKNIKTGEAFKIPVR